MSEHLSSETLTRLLARELRPGELLTASCHIAVCPECRQQLGAAKDLNLSTEFLADDLQRSLRAGDLHLTDTGGGAGFERPEWKTGNVVGDR